TPNKRVVFGGGGVMPDIFVPWDTTLSSNLNKNLIRKGAYNDFILTYLNKNRKKLHKQYPNFDSFNKNYTLEKEFMDEFFTFAEKKKVERNEKEYKKSKKLIDTQLKALLARNLYSISAYFEIINQLNDSYLEALNVIQSDKFEKAKLEYE
ncbi:MAG: hypothetical protein JKY48_07380, partial [Flavobacteriales bacterium]|nr:hypothetical protein [Flavobacteriales bacterium]